MMIANRLNAWALVSLTLVSASARGQSNSTDPLIDWWQGDSLTGSWGGLRERGETRGISVFTEFTADNLWNTSGGMNTGHAYMGLLEFGVELDLGQLTGWWQGGAFKVSGLHAHSGRGLTTDLVGDLNGASNIEAPNGSRLYELWLSQRFFEDKLTLQAGNMLADSYFAYNDDAGTLMNAGFGWSQFIAANTGTVVPAFPFAALGARVLWQPSDQFDVQAAIFDGDSLDDESGETLNNPHGFEFNLNNRWFFIGEIDWKLNQAEGDTGLVGTYGLGGFYHSRDAEDLYADDNGAPWIVSGLPPRRHDGVYGAYLTANQQVYREDEGQGLSLFARVAGLPANRSYIDFVVDGGLTYTGLLPRRDNDVFSVGVVYVEISGDQTLTEETDNAVNGTPYAAYSDYELVFEATYQAWINEWWYVQPDLQYIAHPGGSAAWENSLVVGIRTGISF